jgi:hypothetical protein
MAFEEDLSLFLSADEFAVPVQAVTRHSEVVQFQVIFDNGYSAQLGGYADGTQPTALARSVDVADLVQGCAFTVAGADWLVTDLQPDGTGMTLIVLRKP